METPKDWAGAFTELAMSEWRRRREARKLPDLPPDQYNAVWEAVYSAASIHSPDRDDLRRKELQRRRAEK